MLGRAIGDMRQRVTLRTLTRADDSAGGETLTWTDRARLWAAVDPTNGREFFQGGVVQNTMGHTVRLRYHADLQPAARLYVEPDGPLLEIAEVKDEGFRHRFVTVACLEVGA